jgi:hypothetical protein
MDLAAVRFFQASDHAQGRRFAASAGSEKREKFALGDLEIDAINRDHAVEGFVKVLNAEEAHGVLFLDSSSR